jgi:hypothetical protein
MKIRQATTNDQKALLALMQEAHGQDDDALPEEWLKTKAAAITLLRDPLAGEAQLIFDEENQLVGYVVMCRGFSLDYGGYFTWIEETYIQEEHRFRDQKFLPSNDF